MKSINCVKDLLKRKNLTINEIDELILVGGPTQIPAFRKLIEKELKKPNVEVNPMTAVAEGAAIYAANINSQISDHGNKIGESGEGKEEIVEELINYVKAEVKKGTRVNQVMRHTLGLFHGKTGSSHWKRYLSENMCVRDADVKKIDHIMDKVKLSPKLHSAGQID